MKPVRVISGRAVPLDRSDVDTDQIIPASWLKRVERTGFGQGLFSEWRDDREFVLNRPEHAGATVLVAGPTSGPVRRASTRSGRSRITVSRPSSRLASGTFSATTPPRRDWCPYRSAPRWDEPSSMR